MAAAAATTDFFQLQDNARRTTRWLVGAFGLAVLFVVASYCVAVALGYIVVAKYWGLPWRPPVGLLYATAALVVAVVVGVSLRRMWRLSEGGSAVAELLGARYVEPGSCTATERRFLNVVEEMAIASGIGVPPVYLLDQDDAVNALVAGHSPNQAVIVATRGAVIKLTRDELQGIMGHEFSHILNGDMALNLRLVGILAGLEFFGDVGEALVQGAARKAAAAKREARGGEAVLAVFGALVAYTGFPGTLAADAIKAAISRQRELLADAASVQLTRNPDGIAGALDSILSLRAATTVNALHASEMSHMFFALAVVRWWGFATHPPIEARIRHAHPRFNRDEYRATREGLRIRREVAVLDGGGNVVKTVSGIAPAVLAASVGHPERSHLDIAARILSALPDGARERLKTPAGAAQTILELARAGGRTLPRSLALPLCELALPVLRSQRQPERDAFVAELKAAIEADQRVTLGEFVLLTYFRQHLREGAGKPIPALYRKVGDVAAEAHVVLSLVAHAAGADTAAAFAKGAPALGISLREALPLAELSTTRIAEALERLRLLAPLEKPRILKACLDAAAQDGVFRIAEVELVRAIAATLDCPVPPVVAALDPAKLTA